MKTNNGYDLSRKWFDFAFEHSEVKCQHTALFMWIIELNNRLGWKEQFGIPTNATMEGLHIGNKRTYLDALSDLAKWNFIQIISESKNQYSSTIISICRSKKATALHTALDTALIQHSNGIDHSIEHSSAPIDKQRNQETKKQRNNRVVFSPPSENDIYNLMGELNMKAGGKWDEAKINSESKNCFDHYTSTGWKTSGGAKIVSWESTVRKWMNNAFKFEHNQKTKSYGKQSNSTADSIAKANQLYADAVAISRARYQAEQNQRAAEG
jgi:hypothetical protein